MPVAEKHHTDWKRAPVRWSSAGGPALLLLICICFFWKLILTNQYTWLAGPDAANQVLPWYQFEAGEWHHGEFPLWDPYLWGGQPLLAQGQPGAAYPPNWLLFLAPLRRGWIAQQALHWYWVLIHFQAALFCYWLCRDLKRSRSASLLAGLVFAFGGFVGTNGWPQMVNGAVWAPLILLFFLRAMRGERPVSSSAWAGAFLGIAFLSGHHQIPVFLGLTMGGLWLYYLLANRDEWRSHVKLLFIFYLFAVLLASFQALPTYQYGKLSVRWVGTETPAGWRDTVPYFIHQRYELYAESLLGIVVPGLYRNSDPYVGLAALTLALFGVIAAWRERMARLFAAIALGGLLFSLGHNSVFHGILYAVVPMVEKARNPSMASFIFHFGLCVLIAFGIDNYELSGKSATRRAVVLLCGFSALTAAMIWFSHTAKIPVDDRMGAVLLAGLLLAATLAAWSGGRISHRAGVLCAGLLMLFELGNTTTYGYPARAQGNPYLQNLAEHADIATFLNDQVGPVRVEINEADIPYNFGDWYGIDHFGGYLASLTENVNRVQGNLRARTMYGVNFYVGKQPLRPGQVELFTGASGIKVYRNPEAYPRAWIVHKAESIVRDDQITARLDDPGFDPRRGVFVKGPAPPLAGCPESGAADETALLAQRRSGYVILDVSLKCRGMVIYSDTFFPGWEAAVDGRPAALYEAYGFLRGVAVDAGSHRIEMRYRPAAVYAGAALSLAGLLGACLLTRVKW